MKLEGIVYVIVRNITEHLRGL